MCFWAAASEDAFSDGENEPSTKGRDVLDSTRMAMLLLKLSGARGRVDGEVATRPTTAIMKWHPMSKPSRVAPSNFAADLMSE
eukprot:4743162-Pyramimonas_sp.AAC.1